MHLKDLKSKLPENFYLILEKEIKDLRPSQEKSVKAGLLERKNLLVCTPTASGKTLIAELAGIKSILEKKGKLIYVVPLKSLANEKYKEFTKKYSHLLKIAISIGNLDSSDPYLNDYDIIITTSEKLDSLIRHHAPWLESTATIVFDEIHLLNDVGRGPTLEILITIIKQILKNIQIIGLSATIGNPEDLADWLDAKLVTDSWRPVELKKGVFFKKEIEFNQTA